MFKSEYLNDLMARVERRNPGESEFHQTVREVLESIEPVLEQRPQYIKAGVIERLVVYTGRQGDKHCQVHR